MNRCALCDCVATDRLCGFDVCGSCRAGYVRGPLDTLGFSVSNRRWRDEHGDTRSQQKHLEITVRHPTPLDVTMMIQPNNNPPRWLAWLIARVEGIQVGDPLFDDAVIVTGRDESAVRELMANEGVQAAAMELAALGTAKISPGRVVATTSGKEDPDEPSLSVPTILMALHLEQRATGRDA